MNNGTSEELKVIAQEVLNWVNTERKASDIIHPANLRMLRKIELCATAVIEQSMLLELYNHENR